MLALAGDSDGESGGGAGPLVGPVVCGPGRIAQARHPPPPLEGPPPERCKFQRQVPVKKVMRWVQAASFLKSTKKIKEAAVAFSLALQEDANDDDAAVALAQGSAKCREILRQARCRIDAMAMQGFRAYWKDLVDNGRVTAANLWIGGSPQWRGVEMFAGSLEVWVGDEVQRWLIPCVSLEAGQLDGASKTKACMWALFLMAGPNRHYLQRLLSLVTGIVTDHGVESAFVGMPGCIGAFLASIGGQARGW